MSGLYANQQIVVDITHVALVNFLDENKLLHSRCVRGRVGCFFRDAEHIYGLSASHVLLAPGNMVSIEGKAGERVPIGVVTNTANDWVTWKPSATPRHGQFVVRRWWQEDYAVFRLNEDVRKYVDPDSIVSPNWLNVGNMYAIQEAALLQLTPQPKYANFRRLTHPESVVADYESYFLHVAGIPLVPPMPGDSGSTFIRAGNFMALAVVVTIDNMRVGVLDVWSLLDQLLPF